MAKKNRQQPAFEELSVSDASSSIQDLDTEELSDVLTVKQFAEQIQIPFSMSVASKRNTGKTMLISALIQALLAQRKIDMVLVMSQTVHVNEDYWFRPEMKIIGSFHLNSGNGSPR